MLWRLAPAGEELLHGLISDLTPAFSDLAARFGSLRQARAMLLLRQLDDLGEAIKHHERHSRQSDTEQTTSGQQGPGKEAA
jgi:hypothetical protein